MRTVRVVMVLMILSGFVAPAAAEGWGWLGGESKETAAAKKKTATKSWWTPQSKKKKDDGFFSLVRGDNVNKTAQKKSFNTTRTHGKPEEKPSFWESLFGKEEPKTPQTVKEWMAQPRIDP